MALLIENAKTPADITIAVLALGQLAGSRRQNGP